MNEWCKDHVVVSSGSAKRGCLLAVFGPVRQALQHQGSPFPTEALYSVFSCQEVQPRRPVAGHSMNNVTEKELPKRENWTMEHPWNCPKTGLDTDVISFIHKDSEPERKQRQNAGFELVSLGHHQLLYVYLHQHHTFVRETILETLLYSFMQSV